MARRRLRLIAPPPTIVEALRIRFLRAFRAISPKPVAKPSDHAVRYTPLGHGSLVRALSARGPGHMEYLARFPSGQTMRITATRRREFADIAPPSLVQGVQLAAQRLLPGGRVVVLGSSTGWPADILAAAVGPAGGVLAIEPELASHDFAVLRYDRRRIAFERGTHELLAEEIPGSFDASLVLAPLPTDAPSLRALARVTSPAGPVMAVTSSDDALTVASLLQRSIGDKRPPPAQHTIGPVTLIESRGGSYPPQDPPTEEATEAD